jgi:hypothetical protein
MVGNTVCINDFAHTLVWILKYPLPWLNVPNLLCWLAGRSKTEFFMANFHLGKKICFCGTWKKFYQCLQKIHKLCRLSRACLEKLIISQPVMKFTALRVHYPISHELVTCVYHDLDKSNLHYINLFALYIF